MLVTDQSSVRRDEENVEHLIYQKQQSQDDKITVLIVLDRRQNVSFIVILFSLECIKRDGMIPAYLSLADSSVHFKHPSRPLQEKNQ
jgi:hypothetical protein